MLNERSGQFNYCDYFVRLYLENIGPLEVLTSRQEYSLLSDYSQGNQNAFQELILKNQYIVIEEVLYFVGKGIELLDLLQNANLALIFALKRYTNDKGSLKNYLHRNIYRNLENITPGFYSIVRYPANIIREIKQFMSDVKKNDMISNSAEDLYKNFNKYDKSFFYHIYVHVDDGITDISELSNRIDIDLDNITEHSSNFINYDLLINSLKDEINRQVSALTSKERNIVKMYFGLDRNENMTLEEIGQEYNLTRERVRQIKENAIQRLRHVSRAKYLKGYLNIFDSLTFFIFNEGDYSANSFTSKLEDESCAIELLEKYVEPRRRQTPYPDVPNISELCRKLIKDYLEKQGKPCSYDILKNYVYNRLPLLKEGSFDYALSTSEDVISLHNGLYSLENWVYKSKVQKKSNNEIRQKPSHKDAFENKKLDLDSAIINEIDFTFNQLSLIQFFLENNGKLSRLKITIYARSNNFNYNQILHSINKKFVEEYNEPLVKEENSNLTLNSKFII